MKKIFFFALASLALASCSQDEEFVAENNNAGSNRTNSETISFSTYTAGGTRATVVTSDTIKESLLRPGFQVAARYDNKVYFKDNALFEIGLAVDPTDQLTGAFDTEGNTYWWPRLSTTDTIGFRAFNNLIKPADWTDADCEKIKYTVQSKVSEQEDLVVAYAVASEKPKADGNFAVDGVQPLNFTHALSKVNFTFKGEKSASYKYVVNKVEVIAAGQKDAVMTFAQTTENNGVDKTQPTTGTQADKVKWAFTPIETVSSSKPLVEKGATAGALQGTLYSYYDSKDSVPAKQEGFEISGADAAYKMDENFMLLPQSGKIAVRVYYKILDGNDKMISNCGHELTDNFGHHESDASYDDTKGAIRGFKTVILDLSGSSYDNSDTPLAIPSWEAGKAYRFTMTLPFSNFIGDGLGVDGKNDNVPDGLDGPTDLDGDGDTDDSEFDTLTPIRFSVTVSDWTDYTPALSGNITIK